MKLPHTKWNLASYFHGQLLLFLKLHVVTRELSQDGGNYYSFPHQTKECARKSSYNFDWSRVLSKVKESLYVKYYSGRLCALSDRGGQPLLKYAKANFSSYAAFLPRKRYIGFQHAWFMHIRQIRQYIDGTQSQGVSLTRQKEGWNIMVFKGDLKQ